MKRRTLFAAVAIAVATLAAGPVLAADNLKIGLVAPFSGPFADYGKQIEAGIKAYMAQHGNQVAGRKVEIIVKDTGGSGPEAAKRLSQELVSRDKVDFLAGYGLTPEAMATAPIAQQAKTPMIIMNAATVSIPQKSQYIARVSLVTAHSAYYIGKWAAKNNIKKVVTLVADYGPGIDSEAAFKAAFAEGGGQVTESIRTPLNSPDFSPFLQRIKDAKPDAMFVFVPAGEQSIGIMKSYRERGLADAGIKMIGTGDLTDDNVLPAMGDASLGVITAFHYSANHNSPENKTFLQNFAKANPNIARPNFMAVAGYDGMDAIYQVTTKLNGKIEGDKAMEILKGLKIKSPRGPLTIDPEIRDVSQTQYIRRVEKVNGQLYNVEFESFPDVKGALVK
ncbi:amino acid/amide ABC transporter substrate-binding protein, HAAT family [Noviherbaspirillum humi]|uniref:Amino acid/amide ABC transporter substrate-binding protein, HAAT family n=1 Tax=Noviherbaspirillum humi TaxID=1688639 RepID=A0A239I2P8_9BURK|nr:ABC transporter substrate-binding protein [Noviherbaspirillum humi]SNS87761.1 amino acid/amide ABC transporter substrate-binding protein, HAAT family [Noviherbaspirillum humi]